MLISIPEMRPLTAAEHGVSDEDGAAAVVAATDVVQDGTEEAGHWAEVRERREAVRQAARRYILGKDDQAVTEVIE